MRAYSLDLRERVVRAVDQGHPRSEIVKLLGMSSATIKRYLKRRRETGHLHQRPIPGRPPQKRIPLCEGLVAQLEAHPDATLEMLPALGTGHRRAREREHDFLPSYSPDFSPIEEMFSEVKTQDAQGWFRHCELFPQAER